MTIVLLDERWPSLIPMEAHAKLAHPVAFTGEVPVSVRWNFDELVARTDPSGRGTLVSTNAFDPQVVERMQAGEDMVEAQSRREQAYQAQQVMERAVRIGEWEMTQTHESLLPFLREEAEEFAAAVRSGAPDAELLNELGDVLLQVLFHAELASRRGAFNFEDVAASFVAKMRNRAPYLFDGTTSIVSIETQERLWAEGKARA